MSPDRLGAHMSIAGGLPEALTRGTALGCGAIQIFVKNQVQWAGRALHEDEVREFGRRWRESAVSAVFAHGSYLVNLATPDPAEWRRAVLALADELERCERLGLPFLVLHPGSHRGTGRESGLGRVASALDEVTRRTPGYRVRVALENTAGGGSLLGATPADLAAILTRTARPERLGCCLDTCHLFAAGHDIRTAAGLSATLNAYDRAVGWERVLAFHLNDARSGLGSALDRHENIGQGQIGAAAFARLLRHPALGRRPMVLETPKTGDGDARNLALLRALGRRSPGVATRGDRPPAPGPPAGRAAASGARRRAAR